MSTKVSPFMGGLGRDVTSKFEITDDASVTIGDGTNGGNVAVGDNGAISFGAGSDLRIYHTGLHSYIDEAGTGNFYLNTNGAGIIITGTGATQAQFFTGGAVNLFYNNSQKLGTTATGVNVTGDVGGDTLTISGDVSLGTNSSNTITLTGSVDLGTL